MRATVLFVGDADVDLVLSGLSRPPVEDREVFCSGFAEVAGGSTLLAAAAYARLGGAAEFCGLVGEDHYGRLVESSLREAGVGTSLLRAGASVATGITVNLSRGSTRTQVTFPGSLGAMDETEAAIAALARDRSGASEARYAHLHLSGLYGMASFRPRAAELLSAARSAGLSTSLDTQWDESELWDGVSEWLPLLDYLFVNADEARSITGRADPAAAWVALAERTACPIVKLGPEGAYAAGRAYPSFRVDVVDPTGAGDSFAGGFLYATIEEDLGFDEALRLASAAGAIACTYRGGMDPALNRQAVRELAG